jgi:predicted PurR-regulated permease PerM
VLRSLQRALWVLALCAVAVLLRAGRELLIPLLLALLLALILSGVVEGLKRWHVPRALAALALLLLIAGAAVGTLDALWSPAQRWIASAPHALRTVEYRLRPAQSVVRQIDAITRRARALAGAPSDTATQPAPAVATVSAVDAVAAMGSLAGEIALGMALALLLLAAGPPALARMAAAAAPGWRTSDVLRLIDAVRLEVGRYYCTLALINAGFGLVVGVMTWMFGLPNPLLWGVLAGVLNFIPYLGCATTLAILTLVSFVTFDNASHTLLVAASFLVAAGIEGHIIEPIFFGRRFDLNPIVILVALWVGGWMWGISGVVFTMPVLVATKAAAAHARRGGAWLRCLGPLSRRPDAPHKLIPGQDAAL